MSLWDKPGVTSYIEDYWDSPNEAAMRQAVADWIRPQVIIRRFLDVGCGSARMFPLLSGCFYSGVDGSAEMLKLARGRAPYASFTQADILADPLPYDDDAYDAALCMHVMRHMSSYKSLLLELERVVKTQVFIVDVFHHGDSHMFNSADISNQTFAENTWSLPLFLADVAKVFPGWNVSVVDCAGAVGVEIEAP